MLLHTSFTLILRHAKGKDQHPTKARETNPTIYFYCFCNETLYMVYQWVYLIRNFTCNAQATHFISFSFLHNISVI